MNPYLIIGLLVAVLGISGGSFGFGYHQGTLSQKATDQLEFNKVNKGLADQKAKAANDYIALSKIALDAMDARDKFKTDLENEHENNQRRTINIERKLASSELRFATREGAGCGDSSNGSDSTKGKSDSFTAPSVIQLPRTLTADLRQLVKDADDLRDNYIKCYSANQGKIMSDVMSVTQPLN